MLSGARFNPREPDYRNFKNRHLALKRSDILGASVKVGAGALRKKQTPDLLLGTGLPAGRAGVLVRLHPKEF